MFSWLRSRNQAALTARELYGSVVAAARNPVFYLECGVPDTPEGRYEMVVLCLSVLLSRLKDLGENGKTVARDVSEAFVEEMDDAFRAMGVGDLGVSKKVKRAAAGLFERSAAYGAAAQSGEEALSAAVSANIAGTAGEGARRIARHMLATAQALQSAPPDAILAGKFEFPAP